MVCVDQSVSLLEYRLVWYSIRIQLQLKVDIFLSLHCPEQLRGSLSLLSSAYTVLRTGIVPLHDHTYSIQIFTLIISVCNYAYDAFEILGLYCLLCLPCIVHLVKLH
jgi:hypothetical protein